MSTYTITRETILAARKGRSKQVKAARGELLKALADDHNKWDAGRIRNEYRARILPTYAHIELVNGTTIHAAVNISRLAEWARLTQGTLNMRVWHVATSCVPTMIILETERQPGIRSSVTMNGWNEVETGKGYRNNKLPMAALGHPIRLVAPADGGEFILDPTSQPA